jgi:formate dehydrogenase
LLHTAHATPLTRSKGGSHARDEPRLLGTTENELGIRKWIEDQGHELVTTSDKEGEGSEFDKHLVDAEVIITTPYVCRQELPRNRR